MKSDKLQLIKNYYNIVKSASKETPKKEALKDLLNRLYSGDKEIQSIIGQITLRGGKIHLPVQGKLVPINPDELYCFS